MLPVIDGFEGTLPCPFPMRNVEVELADSETAICGRTLDKSCCSLDGFPGEGLPLDDLPVEGLLLDDLPTE